MALVFIGSIGHLIIVYITVRVCFLSKSATDYCFYTLMLAAFLRFAWWNCVTQQATPSCYTVFVFFCRLTCAWHFRSLPSVISSVCDSRLYIFSTLDDVILSNTHTFYVLCAMYCICGLSGVNTAVWVVHLSLWTFFKTAFMHDLYKYIGVNLLLRYGRICTQFLYQPFFLMSACLSKEQCLHRLKQHPLFTSKRCQLADVQSYAEIWPWTSQCVKNRVWFGFVCQFLEDVEYWENSMTDLTLTGKMD